MLDGFWRTPSPKYASERVYTDIRGAQAVNNQSDGRSGRTKMQKQAYVLRDANVPSEGTHT